MQCFVVLEAEDGLMVAEVPGDSTPEAEAKRVGGVLVDPTPYATYEDAYDALLIIDAESKADAAEPLDP